jgi:cysteine desulfurase
LENCAVLEKLGIFSSPIGLDSRGMVTEEALQRTMKKNPGARMAAIMAVNNETGSINDIGALTTLLKNKAAGPPVHVHSDLVQGAGKIPLNIEGWGIDSASISAHKIGGMRGTGLLYLRKPVVPLIRGGGQEGGIRPGTENTAGALDLAARLEERAGAPAAEKARAEAEERMNFFICLLRAKLPGRFFPIPEDRGGKDGNFSPWILQARFTGIPGGALVRFLDEAGFAVSTGSACSSGGVKRPVLQAMGADEKSQLEGIRISQGWSTSAEDIDALALALVKACREL